MSDAKKVRIGKLDTIGGVIVEMGRVYRQMRRSELDTLDGARLVGALREIRCAMERGDFERRIEALEVGDGERFRAAVSPFGGTAPDHDRSVH